MLENQKMSGVFQTIYGNDQDDYIFFPEDLLASDIEDTQYSYYYDFTLNKVVKCSIESGLYKVPMSESLISNDRKLHARESLLKLCEYTKMPMRADSLVEIETPMGRYGIVILGINYDYNSK